MLGILACVLCKIKCLKRDKSVSVIIFGFSSRQLLRILFIRFQFEAVVMIEWQRPKLTSLIQAGLWRIHPTHSVHTVLLYPTQMFVKSGSIKNIKFCLQSLNKVFVFFSKGVISNSQRHSWFTTRPFKHLSVSELKF